jgi:AraC family transcriptional regulator of adaptative response / DNA-3-methyladenine glycosylase II
MDIQLYEQARQARDPRFDGRFFVGVKTTGIYCRPVCPVKIPLKKNVTLYQSAAAASEAGFRPCLRCRPETSPGTPAWMGTSTTVSRALRLISEGALDDASVEALSDRLGVGSRHLSRLFAQYLGASPKAVAQTRRLHFAKKLLDETSLSITEVAFSSGYNSVRRFNDHFKSVYSRAPGTIRKKDKKSSTSESLNCDSTEKSYQLRLTYRPPFDFHGILAFLAYRAIPGVETVTSNSYSRTIRFGEEVGVLLIDNDEKNRSLNVNIDLDNSLYLFTILERVKRLFDLTADPMEINSSFGQDSSMKTIVEQNPGQRVPGSWDPFEISVRAIVGQQVSVKGATTIMGRIAKKYGCISEVGLCFPTASELSKLDTTTLSMPQKRAQAIKDLSVLVASGELDLEASHDPEKLVSQLVEIKGIGPWTAHYIAMRAIGDPDAFLHGDLVLLKVAKALFSVNNENELLEYSSSWRPWRAYAGMHLWRQAANLTA